MPESFLSHILKLERQIKGEPEPTPKKRRTRTKDRAYYYGTATTAPVGKVRPQLRKKPKKFSNTPKKPRKKQPYIPKKPEWKKPVFDATKALNKRGKPAYMCWTDADFERYKKEAARSQERSVQ